MKITSPPTFDIKVALVGYVSVGKTTLLNALFREKYGEVAMRRTTASVNHYRVSNRKSNHASWTPNPPIPSNEVLQTTVQANARLRTSDTVEEAWFDIELDHDFCEMREDTRLVLVDVPGINEAGTSSKYKDYVTNNWHTFDCVVVVMDGRQGVNTDEQVDLLKLAKSNCDNIKSVPVIVLCNKIDDPEEEEQMLLIDEAREVVQDIFQTEDQVKALREVVEGEGNTPRPKAVILPVSAVHAFIYRTATRVGFEDFKLFDLEHIEKLGKDNFGMKWRRFSKQTKFHKAFQVVSDSKQCQDGIELSNFETFTAVLSFFIGGKETQASLLKYQMETALKRLSVSPGIVLADELRTFYVIAKELNQPTDEMPKHFWVVLDRIVENSFESFKTPADVHLLSDAMHQLFLYVQFIVEVGWTEETKLALSKAKTIVIKQATAVMYLFDHPGIVDPTELVLIYGSLLLQSGEPFFYENFGLLKILMDRQRSGSVIRTLTKTCPSCRGTLKDCKDNYDTPIWQCNNCGSGTYFGRRGTSTCPREYMANRRDGSHYKSYYEDKVDQNGHCSACGTNHQFVDDDFPKYDIIGGELKAVAGSGAYPSVLVPDSLEDPNHFGHLIWQFGRIVKASQATASSVNP